MSLKTSSEPASFPRADEENEHRDGADHGSHEGDPIQGCDHQA
jgi:hypothetical protein